MELVIKKGSCSVEGPADYEVVDSQITMNGSTYTDFAEVFVQGVTYSIVNTLPADLIITIRPKKRKKILGIF